MMFSVSKLYVRYLLIIVNYKYKNSDRFKLPFDFLVKWKFIVTLIFFLFIVSGQTLLAQSYQNINFTKNDGLPSNYVYGVVQDELGYIYAYTDNGIAKYDGYNWRHISIKEGLPGTDVYTMMQDKYGVLHGQCFNGRSFRIIGDSIHVNKFSSVNLSSYKGKAIYDNKFIFDEGILNINDLYSKAFSLYPNNNELPGRSYCFIISHNTYIYYQNSRFKLHKLGAVQSKILLSDIGENYKGHLVNNFNKDHYTLSLSSCAVFLDTALNVIDTIVYVNKRIFDEYIILNTFKDRDENIWIGTKNKGILFIPASYRLLTAVDETYEDYVQSIVEIDSNSFLFSTDRGKLFFQKDNNIEVLKDYGNRLQQVSYLDGDTIIVNSNESCDLWTVDGHPKLVASFLVTLQLSTEPSEKETISEIVVKSLDFDEGNKIYFTSIRLGTYKSDGNIRSEFISLGVEGKNLIQEKTLPGEVYWRGDSELKFYDSYKGLIEEKLDIEGISASLSIDNEQFLIGTHSNGLYVWNRSSQALKKISEINGVQRIRYTNGQILVCTEEEVFHYKKGEELMPVIIKEDGLPITNINDIMFLDSTYYLGTDLGLVKFVPNDLKKHTLSSSPIYKFSFSIDNTYYSEQDSKFGSSQNDVLFEYALTHYPSQENIEYRYRLLPIEADWKTTTANKLNYVNLQPNNYKFELFGKNIYGQEFLIGKQTFKITRAFYNTWWFSTLVLLLLGFIFYKILKSRQKVKEAELTKELELKQQMASIKLSALKAQMNPHFVFNALGSIQYYIQKNEQDLADEYLGQFATLMRMYLDASKEDTIPLSVELDLLQHYIELEQMRFEDLFTYELDIDLDFDLSIHLPTMLLQPIVENAINHGIRMRNDKGGKLKIKIDDFDNIIVATITDNGIGVEAARQVRTQKHKSQSSSILSEKIINLKEQGLFEITIAYQNAFGAEESYPGTQVTLKIETLLKKK